MEIDQSSSTHLEGAGLFEQGWERESERGAAWAAAWAAAAVGVGLRQTQRDGCN